MPEIIEQVKADGWLAIFPFGNPAYYERFGFTAAAADRYATSYPKRNFMALALVPGSLANLPTAYREPAALIALS